MADATISSLQVQDGVLHIMGANFTQTTTTVYVDDVTATAAFVSSTELTIDPAPAAGAEIVVEKAGVQSAAMSVPAAGAPAAQTDPAAEPPAGGGEGNTGLVPNPPEAFLTEQEKGGPDPVSEAVDPGPAAETMKLAPKEPYPTGSPAIPPKAGVPMNETPPEAA